MCGHALIRHLSTRSVHQCLLDGAKHRRVFSIDHRQHIYKLVRKNGGEISNNCGLFVSANYKSPHHSRSHRPLLDCVTYSPFLIRPLFLCCCGNWFSYSFFYSFFWTNLFSCDFELCCITLTHESELDRWSQDESLRQISIAYRSNVVLLDSYRAGTHTWSRPTASPGQILIDNND